GLMIKEDEASYIRLLENFLKAMGSEPYYIITNQDPAMKNAVQATFKQARHRLCMWHIMEKVNVEVPTLAKDNNFMKRQNEMVWDIYMNPEEFEEKWGKLMNDFALTENQWFTTLFHIRNSWIPAYFKDSAHAEAERAYDLDPTPENRTAMHRCHAEYQLQLLMEEDFWKQKAAVRWVAEGERNTRFFQGFVRQKRAKSYIHSIEADGSSLTQESQIRDLAVDHFQALFTADRGSLIAPTITLFPTIPPLIDIVDLCELPSREEVRDAVFGIDPNSVSGPDGFSSLFYQVCWDIIQPDVEEAVLDFFAGHRMPDSFTATSVVLIPKRPNPSS
ncbi:Unknown protein, partial [Striga hermonthica]